MRPREVQARLRAGSTVQEVAELSGWPADRVAAFGVPVLQERSFIAERAAASAVRHGNGERPLTEVVLLRLRDRGVSEEDLRWDAWRSQDNGWTVLLAYPAAQGNRVATWSFDNESRTLISLDDAARWLTGEEPERAPSAPVETEDTAVSPIDETGADVVQIGGSRGRQTTEVATSRHPAGRRQRGEQSAQGPSVDGPTDSVTDVRRSEPSARQSAGQPAQPSARSPRKAGKRQPVPSWDDILFGGASEDR